MLATFTCFRVVLVVAIITNLATLSFADEQGDGVKKIQKFLKEKYADKKLQTGPTRIESDELTATYGEDQQFYFVFSAPPLPPGAPLPELLDTFKRRLKEHTETSLSLAIRIDKKGAITALPDVAALTRNVKPVKGEADAKTTAAAVISLHHSGRVGPGVVSAEQVMLRETDAGLLCTAQPTRFYQATVLFDSKGMVKRVTKSYTGPLPP